MSQRDTPAFPGPGSKNPGPGSGPAPLYSGTVEAARGGGFFGSGPDFSGSDRIFIIFDV